MAEIERVGGPSGISAAVLGLVAEIQREPPYSYRAGEIRPADEWFPELVTRSDSVFVAYSIGSPVGYCVALPISAYGKLGEFDDRLGVDFATTAYVAELGVAGRSRRQGIASQLLERVHDALEPEVTGIVVRTLAANEPAIAFYRRHGYRIVDGVRQEWNGRTRVFLTRRRAP